MGEFEFDADTRLEGDGPAFTALLGDRWSGRASINGGFLLALCTRALGRVLPFPDPLVVSGFYLRPGSPGPARVTTEVLRSGKTTAFGHASLWRDGKEILRATAAFTDLAAAAGRAANGVSFASLAPPDLPLPQECAVLPADSVRGITIAQRLEYRTPKMPGWATGQPSGDPKAEFWMRFRDGREPDTLSLPLLVDAAAPPVLEVGVLSTTVELTVHLRARPAPGWLACRALTRHLAGGYHEEDFEIWDSAGTLVAQSRQLALVVG
jgi:acyl-coenzyme A thioesterase PaaI-like protein